MTLKPFVKSLCIYISRLPLPILPFRYIRVSTACNKFHICRCTCVRKKEFADISPNTSSEQVWWSMQWRCCESILVRPYWGSSDTSGMGHSISVDTCGPGHTKPFDSFPYICAWTQIYWLCFILTNKYTMLLMKNVFQFSFFVLV